MTDADTAPEPPADAEGDAPPLLPAYDGREPMRFTNRPPAGATAEGPAFVIEGTTVTGEAWESAPFRTVGTLPIGLEGDVANCLFVRDGQLMYRRDPILRVLGAMVHPYDRERWTELLADADRMVDIGTLGDVLMAVVREVLNRPTGPQPS